LFASITSLSSPSAVSSLILFHGNLLLLPLGLCRHTYIEVSTRSAIASKLWSDEMLSVSSKNF